MPATPAPPRWTITGSIARRGEATVDLTAPAAGLALAATDDRLLGLGLGIGDRIAPADQWQRADDMVAVYDVDDGRRLRATALWRWLPGPPAAWELVVSAQTSLLESDPRMAVQCDLAAGTITWGRRGENGIIWTPLGPEEECPSEAECILVERPADTVIIAAHPGDLRRFDLVRLDGRLRVACRLFATTLEKGVLLRSRVRAAIGPAAARGEAAAIMAGLAAAPLPLTS